MSSESSAAQDHRRVWLDPTFVDGIGPPLEQLEQDYHELLDLGPVEQMRQGVDLTAVSDVLALIKEVKTLRWELAK